MGFIKILQSWSTNRAGHTVNKGLYKHRGPGKIRLLCYNLKVHILTSIPIDFNYMMESSGLSKGESALRLIKNHYQSKYISSPFLHRIGSVWLSIFIYLFSELYVCKHEMAYEDNFTYKKLEQDLFCSHPDRKMLNFSKVNGF